MAHWIIEDHGFGGQYYTCSDCGNRWWSILNKILTKDICSNCGAVIDMDENEYIDETSMLSKSTVRASLQAYCELETKLIQLTGFNLEKLVELFAAGYKLRAPDYKSLTDTLTDFTR